MSDKLINVPSYAGEVTFEDLNNLDTKVRILEAVYGETISSSKVVYANDELIYIASSSDVTCANKIVGVTIKEAAINNLGTVQIGGILENAMWNWGNGPIFLGLNGQLTQDPPPSGFNCQIAVAASPTKIVIGIKNSVLIA